MQLVVNIFLHEIGEVFDVAFGLKICLVWCSTLVSINNANISKTVHLRVKGSKTNFTIELSDIFIMRLYTKYKKN